MKNFLITVLGIAAFLVVVFSPWIGLKLLDRFLFG